ncbi:MAG TPA: hypothetical protein V6D12_00330 [Candidatus Obscuribacterales bacterium]
MPGGVIASLSPWRLTCFYSSTDGTDGTDAISVINAVALTPATLVNKAGVARM